MEVAVKMKKSKKDIDKKLMFDKLIPSGTSRNTMIPNTVQSVIRHDDEDNEQTRAKVQRMRKTEQPAREQGYREPAYRDDYDDDEYDEPVRQPVREPIRKGATPQRRKTDFQLDDLVQKIEKAKGKASQSNVQTHQEPVVLPGKKAAAVEETSQQAVELYNINEEMVAQKIDDAMDKFRCCNCELCRQDITIMALNNMTPKYMMINKNDAPKVAKSMDFSDTTKALMKAILYVKGHARH